MGVASVQLIFGAISRIAAAYKFNAYGIGEEPTLDVTVTSATIMVCTVIVKFSLFCICQKYWYYLDPIGAILVSVYILYTWVSTGWDHLSKLSGKSAEPEFINRIIKVTSIYLHKYKSDPSIAVLAMDHRNDCLSNTVALACAWLGNM
ncbi:hypothetical protein COOONC_05092 [Cooperia oncophora]